MADANVQDFELDPSGQYRGKAPVAVAMADPPQGEVQDIEFAPGGVPDAAAGMTALPGQAAPPAPGTEATPPPVPPPSGSDVVTVPGANGQPVRVALAGLSDEARQRYAPFGQPQGAAAGGMGDVRKLEQQANTNQLGNEIAQENAANDEKTAITQQADVQRKRQDEEFQLRQDAQVKQNRLDAEAAQHQADLQSVVTQREADLKRLQGEQGQMTFDPDRYMKSHSGVADSMLRGIAVALGGIGQAMIPGSRNIALDMLNQAAENDVKAQHEAFQRKGAQVTAAASTYERARQAGMDHNQATLAARTVALQQLETGIKVVGAKYASPETEANRQMALAHVGSEQAKTKAEFDKASLAQATQLAGLRQQQRAFTANRDDEQWNRALELGKLGIEQDRANAAMKAAQAKAAKEALTVGGWTGEAKSPQAYTDAVKIAQAERTLVPKLNELVSFRKNLGDEQWDRTEIAKAKSTAAQVKVALKDKFNLGVMSESDSDLLDNVAQDPTKVAWTPAVVSQLEHLIGQVQNDTEAQLDVMGFSRDKGHKKTRSDFDEQPIAGAKGVE